MVFEKFELDNNEAWVTPDLGRNISEILPHSTPFLNDQSESLDIPSAMDRVTGIEFLIYQLVLVNSFFKTKQNLFFYFYTFLHLVFISII